MIPVSYSRKRKRSSRPTASSQHISNTSTVHTVGTSHISVHSNESILTQPATQSLIYKPLSKKDIEQLKNRIQHGALDIKEILQANYDLLLNNVNKLSIRSWFSKMQTVICCSTNMDDATKHAYTEAITQSCAESSFIASEHKVPSQRASLILRQIYDRTLPLNCTKESLEILKQECSQTTALQHMRSLKYSLMHNAKSDIEHEQIKASFNFSNDTYRSKTPKMPHNAVKDALVNQLLSCNFTPETGPQILHQLLNIGMPINTLRSTIAQTRAALKKKQPGQLYKAMSDSLYVSTKQRPTLDQVKLKLIKKSFRQGTISVENIATATQQLINAKERPIYICEILSRCKKQIKSSKYKTTEEKEKLIKELELSYRSTIQLQKTVSPLSCDTNEITDTSLERIDPAETSHTLQDILSIINTETNPQQLGIHTQHSQIIDMEQLPQISDDILDLFDIPKDLQILEAHELSFLQDTNFERPETSKVINSSQTHNTINIGQKELISPQTPLIEKINLQHIEKGHIDPNILLHSITILLKTTLPETLLHALSLYKINHQYNPEEVSALLPSAEQLICSHQAHSYDSQYTKTTSTAHSAYIANISEQQPTTQELINRALTQEEIEKLKNRIQSASLDITEILQARYDLIKNNVSSISIRSFFNKMKTSISCSSTMDYQTKQAYIEAIIQTGAESSFIESENKAPSRKVSLILREMYECTLPLNCIEECFQILKLECSNKTATKHMIALKHKLVSNTTSSAEKQQIKKYFLFLEPKPVVQRTENRTCLKRKLLSCNFTPETGQQIIQELLDMDTPITTVRRVIAETRACLKKKGTGKLYKAMSDSLYLSKKQHLTPNQLELDKAKKTLYSGDISEKEIPPAIQQLMNIQEHPTYAHKLFSICKSKIQLSNKSSQEKRELIKKIEMLSETTKMDSLITDGILDLLDISDDLQLLETNELTFLQDTELSTNNFAQSEISKIESLNLRHIENGQIDPSLLVHIITILLKTTLPETLLRALSLYEVNHQYDPKDVSEPLSSAAQLIRSYDN